MQTPQECFGIPRRQQPYRAELLLTGGSGAGSSNSQVVYYPTISKNTLGQDIMLTNNSVLASVVTIATAGTYSITFRAGASLGAAAGFITLNKPIGTSSGINTGDSTIIAGMIVDGNGTATSCNVTLNLNPGDFIQTSWSSGGSSPAYNGLDSQRSLRVVRLT